MYAWADHLKVAIKERSLCEVLAAIIPSFVFSTLCVFIFVCDSRGHEKKLCPFELAILPHPAQGVLLWALFTACWTSQLTVKKIVFHLILRTFCTRTNLGLEIHTSVFVPVLFF